jgi:hypothetical protein
VEKRDENEKDGEEQEGKAVAEEVQKKEKENDEEKMRRGTRGGEKNWKGRMEETEKKEGEKSVTSLTCFTVIGFQLRLCSLMMASLCRNTLQ